MCGITGFIDRDGGKELIIKMTEAIANRGPDNVGYFITPGVALGHRRLSILDLSSFGHQPMEFEDFVIVFNGEIYNYQSIRTILKNHGYTFQSNSDTEVILKSFHKWGVACIHNFIGMFAFSIYNKKTGEAWLVRDRVGVKPLYFSTKYKGLTFASELKSFKYALTPSDRNSIDQEALSDFLTLGYVTNNKSILKCVRKLPAGHFLYWDGKAHTVEKYWDVIVRENETWKKRSENDLLDELESLCLDAFKLRMVSDVPVGVFLSAGVDSSLIAALLSRHYSPLSTFTIGFSETEFDESDDARNIASYLQSIHHEAKLGPDDAIRIMNQFYEIYDEPHGDNSCVPSTFVSELAKNNGVKVVLGGDGGDEIFGGYVRYTQYINRWERVMMKPPFLKNVLAQAMLISSLFTTGVLSEKFYRFHDILKVKDFNNFYQTIIRTSSVKELRNVFPGFSPSFYSSSEGSILDQMTYWDLKHYLPDDNLVKMDRATMFNSIEGREPLLDHRIIEFGVQLPEEYKIRSGETKYLLKKLLGRYLPEHLYRLPKRGFGAPLQNWIRQYYYNQFKTVLSEVHPLLNQRFIDRILENHKNGKKDNYSLLWYIFSFQSWYNKWNS